jgi:hypothetical protein
MTMHLKTGTKIRILATCLLLAVTMLGGMPRSHAIKNATGCSYETGRPTLFGCRGVSGDCYECLHSDPFGIIECFESPDGAIMYCRPFLEV